MNKNATIFMTVFMLLTLAACGTAGEETSSPAETTTEAATTVTTITTEAATTTTTTTAAAKSLDDLIEVKEYDESKNNAYTLSSLDFSIPQYWKLDTKNEKDDQLRFYNQPKECDMAFFIINYVELNGTASDFEKSRDDIQKRIMEKQTELSDVTNGKNIDGELNDGLPYRCFYFDGKTEKDKVFRKYMTMIYDESAKKLYYVTLYQPYDTKYNYFSDYASIIDNGTKLNKSAEVSIDSVRVRQDSLGRSIAIVSMTYTNTSNTNEMFFTNYDCRVYQNKVELDNALFVDGVDSSALSKSVQPGGSLTISEAFVMDDTSEITVEVTNLLGTKKILSEKYTIN